MPFMPRPPNELWAHRNKRGEAERNERNLRRRQSPFRTSSAAGRSQAARSACRFRASLALEPAVPVLDDRLEILRPACGADHVALHLVAMHLLEQLQRALVLDALGARAHLELVRE